MLHAEGEERERKEPESWMIEGIILEQVLQGGSQGACQRRLLAGRRAALPQPWQEEVRERQTGFLLMKVLPQQRRKKPVCCKLEYLEAETVSRKLSGPGGHPGEGSVEGRGSGEGMVTWLSLKVLTWQRGD